MDINFKDCKLDINEINSCCCCEKKQKCKQNPQEENFETYDISCTQACNLIIESVALEQRAISLILESESRKIDKAIELCCDVCDLIKLTERSNSLISSITGLEQTLLMKLETAKLLIELNS